MALGDFFDFTDTVDTVSSGVTDASQYLPSPDLNTFSLSTPDVTIPDITTIDTGATTMPLADFTDTADTVTTVPTDELGNPISPTAIDQSIQTGIDNGTVSATGTINADGSTTYQNADGSTTTQNTDGSTTIQKPDGSYIVSKPDGSLIQGNAQGQYTITNSAGVVTASGTGGIAAAVSASSGSWLTQIANALKTYTTKSTPAGTMIVPRTAASTIVGYNAAGQPVNAAGQVVSATSGVASLTSSPYFIPGLILVGVLLFTQKGK